MMPLDDETLQRYFDSDLPPDESRIVRERLAHDAEAAARLTQLAELRALIGEAFEARSASLDSDALFARIEGAVATPSIASPAKSYGAHPRPPLRDVSASQPAPKRPASRRGVMLPAFASLAMAAAAMLVFIGQRNGADQTGPAPGTLVASAPSAANPPGGSRIDDVDFGSSTGTVFEVDNDGVSAAVVWISDDEEPTQ